MNDFIMIDSSCWIKFFRNSDNKIADIVQLLIENESCAICGIIEFEIFQGIKSNKQAEIIRELFSSVKYFDVVREDFINASNLMRTLRSEGKTLALSDILIAEICIRNNIKIFTTDNDFDFIKGIKHF